MSRHVDCVTNGCMNQIGNHATCHDGCDLLDADKIQAEIERLIPSAESGMQWAHICWLESQMIAARFASAGIKVELRT